LFKVGSSIVRGRLGKGRIIYLDATRNAHGQAVAVAYSVKTVLKWIEKVGDPWQGVLG
jgi:hypothetical protein